MHQELIESPTGGGASAPKAAALGNTAWRDLAVLAAFFTVAHGLLLLDNAARWDGWVIYHHIEDKDWAGLLAWGREIGLPPYAYLHYLVGHLSHFLFWYKATTFIAHLTVTLVTYHLLGDFSAFGRIDRLLLGMLIAAFPANLVNVELIMMPAAVFYACFFLATAAYRRSVQSHGAARLVARFVALGLFYLSFMLQSLLVFYAAFLVYALLTWPADAGQGGTRLRLFLQRHADFVVLPLVYWVVRTIWFRPSGYYSEYNAFNLGFIPLAAEWVLALYGGLLLPLARGVHGIAQFPGIALAVLAAVLLLRPLWASARWDGQARLCAVGCGLVCLALLPYVVVGKHPSPADFWSSRFAYLVAPGAGLLVYAGLKWYLSFLGAPRYLTLATVSLIVGGFAATTISSYLDFGIDGLKQEAMVLRFRDQREVAAASTVLVEDSTAWLNAHNRQYRFYDYTGMLKQAFGDERRLGVGDSLYHDRAYMDMVRPFYGRAQWLLANYDGQGPVVRVRVRSDAANWNLRKLYLNTVYLRLRGRTVERDAWLRRLLSIEVLPPKP